MTNRRNLNRGYMKLEVWQRAMDLFALSFRLGEKVSDLKLRSQFRDAAQSISSNIAEGYGRRSLPEYVYFLYVAKGSLAESLTRATGLRQVLLFTTEDFEQFDVLHFETENKLLSLIKALESKRGSSEWNDSLPQSDSPTIQPSNNPIIQ